MTAFAPVRDASWRSLGICLAVLLTTSACSLFGDDDEELQPTELLEFEQTLPVKRLWSANLGDGTEFLRIALSPAGDGQRIYAASYDGRVSALDPENGRRLWRVDTDAILSAGPGVGSGLVVVAGYDGDLIALRSEDGALAWHINIESESLARPLIQDDAVVVYTIDGRLRVFSAFDGSERWSLEQSMPALTLRGSAAPLLVGNTVVAGFDNGRLLAIDVDDGAQEWEAILTPPAGRSDLERLADVDGSLAVVGQDVYAAGHNGRVASLAVESGQVLWAREVSGLSGVAADWNNVYLIGDDGALLAMLRRNGDDVWRQEALIRREPSAPAVFGTSVVVGDFEGYVHFFNNLDGRPVARVRVGKGMISHGPVVIGGRLFVQSESGTVSAFALPEVEAASESADTAVDN